MSTVTELDLFLRQHRTVLTAKKVQPQPVAPGSDLPSRWSDALVIAEMRILASIVVFEVWRLLL
jgi:hypothetical protein